MKNPNIGIARAINRFERAVERKAFKGTIPYYSEDDNEQVQLDAAHRYINREYNMAKTRLRTMLEGKFR
jgi:hypothetical protein